MGVPSEGKVTNANEGLTSTCTLQRNQAGATFLQVTQIWYATITIHYTFSGSIRTNLSTEQMPPMYIPFCWDFHRSPVGKGKSWRNNCDNQDLGTWARVSVSPTDSGWYGYGWMMTLRSLISLLTCIGQAE